MMCIGVINLILIDVNIVPCQNLCIAAAYRPVQELLEEEKRVLCI